MPAVPEDVAGLRGVRRLDEPAEPALACRDVLVLGVTEPSVRPRPRAGGAS